MFFLIILKIINLSLPNWFFQGLAKKSWSGNFLSIYSSGGILPIERYSFVSDSICNEYHAFNETNHKDDGNSFTEKELHTLCSQFISLGNGMLAFMTFSFISIICLCLMLVTLIRSWKDITIIDCTVVVSVIGFLDEIVCISVFAGATRLTLQGNCDYVADYHSTKVCGDYASIFEISHCLVIFQFYVVFWVVYYKIVTNEDPPASVVPNEAPISELGAFNRKPYKEKKEKQEKDENLDSVE